MSKILLYIPQTRHFERAIKSVDTLRFSSGRIVTFIDTSADDPLAHRFANITQKTRKARTMALANDFDALMLVDDDQIVPANAIDKLWALDADIAYGLTVWRQPPHHWSAALRIDEPGDIFMLNQAPEIAQAAWGKAKPVAGVGSFCTLIRRNVLEALPFERRGKHNFDFYLAADAQRAGFKQVCDLSVIVGHISTDPEPRVLWPDNGVKSYREEAL